MKNTIDQILEKIKQDHIKPKPRWQFVLHSVLIWGAVIALIIIASLVGSAVVFNLQNTDWMIRPRLGWSWTRFIFMNLPYFWIALLVVFGVITYYSFKQTKSGYKYAMPIVLLIILLLSIGAGWAAHRSFRGGRWMEERAIKHMPLFQKMTDHRRMMWLKPDKGLIAGTIISDSVINTGEENEFQLQGLRGKVWIIKINSTTTLPDLLQISDKIKIIGKKINEQNFSAQEIKPFLGPGPDMQMPGNKNMPFPPSGLPPRERF